MTKTFKYFFGLRFEVKGLENFEVEGPAIIVSNHQSILDMMGKELVGGREWFSCSPLERSPLLSHGGSCWISPSAIPLGLMEILPDNCTQVGKKELMYTGAVGLIIYLGGVIFINRKSTTSAKMVMAEVAKTMVAENVSVTGGVVWDGCGAPGAGLSGVTATCSA